ADDRSYRVSFAKIHEVFPDFKTAWDVAAGAAQLRKVFESIDMDADTFTGRGHTRLKQLEFLLHTGQLDADLFWTVPA
ncbi:MAG TPA: NAD-dependent dehydratase, partial [Aldersonia sp.]